MLTTGTCGWQEPANEQNKIANLGRNLSNSKYPIRRALVSSRFESPREIEMVRAHLPGGTLGPAWWPKIDV